MLSLALLLTTPALADKDDDHDGYDEDVDCDDQDPNTHPGAPELCDGQDNDCDDDVDEGCQTGDTGYALDTGTTSTSTTSTSTTSTSTTSTGTTSTGTTSTSTTSSGTTSTSPSGTSSTDTSSTDTSGPSSPTDTGDLLLDEVSPRVAGESPVVATGVGCGCSGTGTATGAWWWISVSLLVAGRRRASARSEPLPYRIPTDSVPSTVVEGSSWTNTPSTRTSVVPRSNR